jgi:hypothetical protein
VGAVDAEPGSDGRNGDEGFHVTTVLLSQLAKTARTHGARSILLTLAARDAIESGRVTTTAASLEERLARAARASGFAEIVALSPLLATDRAIKPLFFPKDGHWTAAATELVAPAVAEAVARSAGGRR